MRKALLIIAIQASLFGNPSGSTIVSGDVATHSLSPEILHIQADHQSIIHWDNFSIGLDELIKFIQPSADSTVLNRVVGEHFSEILGHLEANGKVYLINQRGILFGEHAVIDTAAFLTSTLDVVDAEFLSQNTLNFTGSAEGNIINFRTVNAWDGDVSLLGFMIENHGEIRGEHVNIGCGTNILLKPKASERIFIRPNLDAAADEEIGF